MAEPEVVEGALHVDAKDVVAVEPVGAIEVVQLESAAVQHVEDVAQPEEMQTSGQ
jgi:hypothetical protein